MNFPDEHFVFGLDAEQIKKFDQWSKEIWAKGVEKQKSEVKNPGPEFISCWELGYPYAGAIGGDFTFCFTNTSLGQICVVTDHITGEEINLTDYNSW